MGAFGGDNVAQLLTQEIQLHEDVGQFLGKGEGRTPGVLLQPLEILLLDLLGRLLLSGRHPLRSFDDPLSDIVRRLENSTKVGGVLDGRHLAVFGRGGAEQVHDLVGL